MTIKFIHTSDWQIGKVFRFVDNATMGLLQEARLAEADISKRRFRKTLCPLRGEKRIAAGGEVAVGGPDKI